MPYCSMDTAETWSDWIKTYNDLYNKYIYNVVYMHTNPGYCEYSVRGRKQNNVFTRVHECDYSKTTVYI